MTTQDALEKGWKLCPRCSAKKNQKQIDNVDWAVKTFRQRAKDGE
jgi:predicted GNAT family acetyltransferase